MCAWSVCAPPHLWAPMSSVQAQQTVQGGPVLRDFVQDRAQVGVHARSPVCGTRPASPCVRV